MTDDITPPEGIDFHVIQFTADCLALAHLFSCLNMASEATSLVYIAQNYTRDSAFRLESINEKAALWKKYYEIRDRAQERKL